MPKKVLHEVDLLATAKPVKEKTPKKRKAKEEPLPSPPPETAKEIVPNVVEGTDQVKVKKPRTEKQLAADAKRREAALQKKLEKEEEERKAKEAEQAAFAAAEAKKKEAAEKRKAAREAKKAALASAPEPADVSEEEDMPQLPIASSVPVPKEPIKRQKKVELVVQKELVKPKVRRVPEEPRQEALPEPDVYRKRQTALASRRRAPILGSAANAPPPRPRMR